VSQNKSDRREFLKTGLAAIAIPSMGLAGTRLDLTPVDSRFRGHESQWTFVGSEHPWKQGDEGVLRSPTWDLFGPGKYGAYVDDLTRDDYAFLNPVLGDTDLSVDFQIRSGSVTNIGVALRAQDSLRMYCVQVDDIDSRKAFAFHVSLWRQDVHGFREMLADAVQPHPKPAVIAPHNFQEWEHTAPGWTNLRVRAMGSNIEVWLHGQKLIDKRDTTYAVGRTGLIARWAVLFRKLKVSGTPARLGEPWRIIPGTWPRYILPFDGRLGDFETYPQIAHDVKTQTIFVVGNVAPRSGWERGDLDTGIVRSNDGGKTWIDPQKFVLGKFVPVGAGYAPNLFVHKDGHLTCFYDQRPSLPKGLSGFDSEATNVAPKTIGCSQSYDGGHTWSETKELMVSGTPLSKTVPKGVYYIYSPLERLRDGTVLMPCYYWPGDWYGNPKDPIDHAASVVFRSKDDGETWKGPYFIDTKQRDTNEVSVAELADGRLLAWMRSNHAANMWESYSSDQGETWSPLKQTSIVACACPTFLNLRSGAIAFACRGSGTMMKVSPDGGKTWGPIISITRACGMTGMIELPDGRILIVYYTGYRQPARIRAAFLRVKGNTLEPAWD
jgi:BNR repeat protein